MSQSISEIIEICMGKASFLPQYDPDISVSEKALCYLVQVTKNPRIENKVWAVRYGCSQGLIPQQISSDSSENLFLIAQKSFKKEKGHKKIRK